MKRIAALLSIALLSGILILSCQRPDVEEATVTETELAPVQPTSAVEAMITFLSGDVTVMDGGGWEDAAIGQTLGQEQAVRVGADSYCELQFADRANVRVQENTEVALENVTLEPGSTKVDLRLAAGSVLNKVGELTGGERFNVKTATSTCGVRGTEFMVRERKGEGTTLAVKKGRVAVLPASVDVDRLKEKAGRENRELVERIERLESAAPVVSDNQEIVIRQETVSETEAVFREIEQTVDEIVAEEPEGLVEETDGEAAEERAEQRLEKLEELDRRIDRVVEKSTESIGEPTAVSEENRQELDQVDKIRTVELPIETVEARGARVEPGQSEPETDGPEVTGTEEPDAEAEPEQRPPRSVTKISVRAVPVDARILLAGDFVGRGRFSGLFEPGEELAIRVVRDGYREARLDVRVEADADRELTVELMPVKAEAPEQTGPEEPAEPSTAAKPDEQDRPDEAEEPAETSESAEPPETREPAQTAEPAESDEPAEPAESPSTRLGESSRAEQPERVAAAVATERITIRSVPGDAEILLDGTPVGRGRYTREFERGERPVFTVRREQYHERTLRLSVTAGMKSSYVVELSPKALARVFRVSSARIERGIGVYRDILVTADGDGTVAGSRSNGRVLWTVQTENSPNTSSSPAVIGDRVVFTGPKELVLVEAVGGQVVERIPLGPGEAHLFGRTVVRLSGGVGLLPEDGGIRLFDLATGRRHQDRIPVPGGSRMTPAVHAGRVLIANQRGVFLELDPDTQAVVARRPTGAVQPVAGAVSVLAGRGGGSDLAFFAGRRGTVVCVDLADGTVRWESPLSDAVEVPVFHSPVTGREEVYIYSDGTLFGLSVRSGERMFEPLTGLAAPPLYRDGLLYYGTTDGRFVIAAGDTGRTDGSLALPGTPSTTPVFLSGLLYVGTDAGRLVAVNPAGMGGGR